MCVRDDVDKWQPFQPFQSSPAERALFAATGRALRENSYANNEMTEWSRGRSSRRQIPAATNPPERPIHDHAHQAPRLDHLHAPHRQRLPVRPRHACTVHRGRRSEGDHASELAWGPGMGPDGEGRISHWAPLTDETAWAPGMGPAGRRRAPTPTVNTTPADTHTP